MRFINKILLKFCRIFNFLFSDKQYIKICYFLEMGKRLDLNAPMTMNEKLQWLKLYNRNPKYTDLVDKISVKDFIANTIGDKYVVPLLGVWDNVEDIDFNSLPNQFVLKTNHGGGNVGVVICKNKDNLNIRSVKRYMAKCKKFDIYRIHREWPYKNIVKKFFAEMYLGDDIVDYKFYCYNGYVDVVLLCVDRSTGNTKFYFFDKNWELRRYNKNGIEAPDGFTLPKPDGIDEMFEIAAKLSKGFPFVRIDFYNVNGKIYFGEITLFPMSGLDKGRLPEFDLKFGQMIDLSIL